MNFLRPDSSFMQKATKVVYYLYVHLLMTICCIPIITVGASLTAMHYVLLKLHKDEEGNVTKTFFLSFKENFKQATCLWLIYFVATSVLAFDVYFMLVEEQPVIMVVLTFVLCIVLLASMCWGFVLLSRYQNTVRMTLRNSFVVSFAFPGSTLLLAILGVVPTLLALEYFGALPLFLVFGWVLSGCYQPKIYSLIFEKIENKMGNDYVKINNVGEDEG